MPEGRPTLAKADHPRLVVGVMTGTSIDGIDAALVRIIGLGLAMRAELVRHIPAPLGSMQERLRAATAQQPMTAGEFARLAWEFGELHAEVIALLLTITPSLEAEDSPRRGGDKAVGGALNSQFARGRDDVARSTHSLTPSLAGRGDALLDLICIHGQAIFHQPPISWQLVNPAPIAARFQCPIVFDLRQADLAAGGQGAPITPLADWIMFRDATRSRAIVNLGGFCNVTILGRSDEATERRSDEGGEQRAGTSRRVAAETSCRTPHDLSQIRGFDVCVCNQLLDAVAREALGLPFDSEGAAARRGRAKPQAAESLRAILDRQRRGGRSLGTGDEAATWINTYRAAITADDLAASAVEAIAQTIAAVIAEHQADELVVAGGGTRNRALLEAIARGARKPVISSDALGIPIEAREAMAFAILGALCQDGVPITLPQVTGCTEPAPISGAWLRT